jgi:hypothetical protein
MFTAKGRVSDRVAFFRVKGKDYLVVADDQSVYLLDRTGNIRVNLKEAVTKAAGSAIRLDEGSNPAVVFTSPEGTVINIRFDGSVSRRVIRNFSGNHQSDFFDLDGDNQNENLIIDQGIMYAYKSDGTEMFTKSFETSELRGPYGYSFSDSEKRAGVYEAAKQLIYIITKSGTISDGYPKKGGEFFTVGKLTPSGWSLIADGTDGYLYNYELNTRIK